MKRKLRIKATSRLFGHFVLTEVEDNKIRGKRGEKERRKRGEEERRRGGEEEVYRYKPLRCMSMNQ